MAHILQLMSEKFQCVFKVYYSSKQSFNKNTLKDDLNSWLKLLIQFEFN